MDRHAALKANTLFRTLDRRVLRAMADRAEWVEVAGGAPLYRHGEASDGLFILVSGRIRVLEAQEGAAPVTIGELVAGDTVGEISVITGETHSVDAIAVRDTTLLKISRETFASLVAHHPDAMLGVTRLIVSRLRMTRPSRERRDLRSARTFAVVPVHPGVDIEAFAGALTRALGEYGAALRLDANRLDEALGAGTCDIDVGIGERNRAVSRWLGGLEERYRYLVYAGSRAPDAWTRRCLRQADRVLLVAHADQRPFASRNLEWLGDQQLQAECEIVIHGDQEPAADASSWAERIGARAQHRLRADRFDIDMAHLARMVSGHAVCLVLGGGGARGFAHVGLIRALEERDIPIDMVGGTSMGALIAAMVACGFDAQRMLATLRATFVDNNFLNDYSFSRIALINAQKFKRQLDQMFAGRRIEDLATPFYCVSTNLTRGVSVVHEQGDLATWVGASMAVPGIAPPIVHRGELLVDGGLLDAIPFDTMAGLGRGRILVSDVSRQPNLRVETAADAPATSLLSVGAAARHLNVFKILFHTATLTSERESRDIDARADLVLRMPVGDVGMFDWDELDEIVYRGYHHAQECLEGWQDSPAARARQRVAAGRLLGG